MNDFFTGICIYITLRAAPVKDFIALSLKHKPVKGFIDPLTLLHGIAHPCKSCEMPIPNGL